MNRCKNCGTPLQGVYCSHCGQSAKTERITFSFLVYEVFHFFSHMEKGFLFTSFRLIAAPGKTAIDFIEGRRKKYQSPVSYFLIWITIYLVTLFLFEKFFGENQIITYKEYFGPLTTTKFAIRHLSFVLTV